MSSFIRFLMPEIVDYAELVEIVSTRLSMSPWMASNFAFKAHLPGVSGFALSDQGFIAFYGLLDGLPDEVLAQAMSQKELRMIEPMA
jgi:hypothetical protein